jgi:hypothetical protein
VGTRKGIRFKVEGRRLKVKEKIIGFFKYTSLCDNLICIQILQNLLCQWVFDLGVPGDSFSRSILWIDPK